MMRKSSWLVSVGLLVLASPGVAQTAQSSTDTDKQGAQPTQGATAEAAAVKDQAREQVPVDTGNIIITANRRNEALSDVPMAVSAVTADTLRNSGASDIRQLQQVSPSLLVSSTTSEGAAAVARIRGIGTVGDNPGLEGSVATYIDGVYRSRTGVALTELGPLDRIEVLRGPQGTLFGRNASAGVISVITAKPQFTPYVAIASTYGNYNLNRTEATLNAPLGSTVAARLDGVLMRRDGFLTEVISGRKVNDRNRWMLRGQILFQPSDNLSIRIIGDYSKRNEECCAGVYLPAHDYVAGTGYLPTSSIATLERSLGAIINDDPYERKISLTPGRTFRSDVEDGGISGEVVYDFGAAELTSITAYRENSYIGGQDADFNNLDLIVRADDGGFGNKFRTFTQELRLQGTAMNDRLDWLVGAYYGDEHLERRDNISFGSQADLYFRQLVRASSPTLAAFPGYNFLNPFVQGAVLAQLTTNPLFAGIPSAAYPTIIGAIAGQVVNTPISNQGTLDVFNQTDKNYALFTHNIFKVTDRLSLTLGARYTIDEKNLSADLQGPALCSNFKANIGRLNALAAAAAADPTLYGALTPAIIGLATGLTNPTTGLPALAAAPCGLIPNSITGNFESNKHKEERFSGTAVLSYKPMDRLLTYLSYSRGYKAGGFNLDRSPLNGSAPDLDALAFQPELVDAFEAGFKFNGRKVDVNVAVFDEEFRNFQLNAFNGTNFIVQNINSCSESLGGADTDNSDVPVACGGSIRPGVRSRGIEIETFFRPIRDINGSLGVTYANTRYRDNLVGTDGTSLGKAFFLLPGSQISNAPDFTITGSLGWTPRISNDGTSALFYVDARHQSSFNTGSDLFPEKLEDGYTVVNGRVGVRGPGDSWSIELWAQNLFNENYKQVAFNVPLQGSGTSAGVDRGFYPVATNLFGAFLAEPRTFGVTVRSKLSFARPAPVYVAPVALPPPPPAMQTCPDGSMIAADAVCPPPPPPPPPPPAPVERGERG